MRYNIRIVTSQIFIRLTIYYPKATTQRSHLKYCRGTGGTSTPDKRHITITYSADLFYLFCKKIQGNNNNSALALVYVCIYAMECRRIDFWADNKTRPTKYHLLTMEYSSLSENQITVKSSFILFSNRTSYQIKLSLRSGYRSSFRQTTTPAYKYHNVLFY